MGSVVASSQAESYLHTLSNEGSSRQMGVWSTWSLEPQTRDLPVNVTCQKVQQKKKKKKNKKIESAKKVGLLYSEDAQV